MKNKVWKVEAYRDSDGGIDIDHSHLWVMSGTPQAAVSKALEFWRKQKMYKFTNANISSVKFLGNVDVL